jgi:hypothetical protein
LLLTARKTQPTKTIDTPKVNNRNFGRLEAFIEDYLPQNIQRTGLQVLETIHIIGTSNSIDTIKG